MFTLTAHAGEKTYLKRDPLRSDRYQITDSQGKVKGYLKRSVLDPRKTLITDSTGKASDYIKKDVLQPYRKNKERINAKHRSKYYRRSKPDTI